MTDAEEARGFDALLEYLKRTRGFDLSAYKRASLMRRGDPSLNATLDSMLELDRRRRDLLVRVESLKAERNASSDEVARAYPSTRQVASDFQPTGQVRRN